MQKAHTTCALLWLDNQQVITVHIGDVRIYRISNHSISRTRDHSVPQMLLDEGEISETDMSTHPDQNRLTRSISLANKHQTTIKIQPVADKNETFILCSDGFWSNTTQQELIQLSSPASTEQDLINQAETAIIRAKGDSDNVTVQWIRIE